MKNVRFGMAIVPMLSLAQQIQLAQVSELLGYDSVWWADHLLLNETGDCSDCWSVMAAAAVKTRRIQLCTAVSDPHRVHPAVFAQRAATLDQLCRGRLTLGLGSGEAMNLEPFGIEWTDRRVGKVREFLSVVRHLLDSPEPLTLDGSWFQLDRARLQIRPFQNRRIPIHLAALGPQMQRLAGEQADGWVPVTVPAEIFGEFFRPVAEAARAAGRDPLTLDRVASVAIALLEDGETVDPARLARMARPYAGMLVWPIVLERLGIPAGDALGYQHVNPCDAHSLQLHEAYARSLPGDLLGRFLLVGNRARVRQGLRAYVEAGATHFQIFNVSRDPVAAMVALATDILPEFRGRGPNPLARALRAVMPALQRTGLTRRGIPKEMDVWRNDEN
jgi:alkanesulfonate monooxygenase SsuD/methylene tetrahydromethanopterin reductase-like flavin-dependent oxidoreductase (luciferase family)